MNVIKEYAKQIGEADATNEGYAKAAARFMINGLVGYKKNKFQERDIANLANMIEAYAYLLQEAGVKVVAKNIEF